MNYITMTNDQLWDALRGIDKEIKDLNTFSKNDESYNHRHEYLMEERKEIIDTFVNGHGYNPDNLCTTSIEDAIETSQENPDIYPYNL